MLEYMGTYDPTGSTSSLVKLAQLDRVVARLVIFRLAISYFQYFMLSMYVNKKVDPG